VRGDFWLGLASLSVATWRATHLVVADDFPPVRWVRRRLVAGAPEWLGDLVTCCWCASVWIAAGLTVAADLAVGVPAPWLVFGVAAGAAPLLEQVSEGWDLRNQQARRDLSDADATRYHRGGPVRGGR
jgi:Protein of unknown function (DUF1360)